MEVLWIPQPMSENTSEKVVIYSFGSYKGFLRPDGSWICYHLLEVIEQEDGSILEKGEIMPDEWTPRYAVSIEEYPCLM